MVGAFHTPTLVGLLLCALAPSDGAFAPKYPIGLNAAAQLLEVALPSPKTVVKAAYRKKARTAHPDVSQAADATAYFLRITAAYETLLQFSVVAPRATPPPPSRPQNKPQDEPANKAEGDFQSRVATWRVFWQTSLQATQLATEAERKAVQQSVLKTELDALREELATLRAAGAAASAVDTCRARYAQCASNHADVSCAVKTLRARVSLLQKEAMRMQANAQHRA